MKTLYFLISLNLLACSYSSVNKNECFGTVKELETQLLNTNDTLLKHYKNCYTIRMSDIEDEEGSGLTWKKYQFVRGSKVVFEAETSPSDSHVIHRITILDSTIKYRSNKIYVGQYFENIRTLVKYGFWDESYGVFFVKVNKKSNVSIELQSKGEEDFSGWEQDISKIPGNVQISCIILTDNSR